MREYWSIEETRILLKAVSIYGEGNWSKIIEKTGMNKTATQLKDKWRNLKKTGTSIEKYFADQVVFIDCQYPCAAILLKDL
tara:strand:- start:1223 stop:1465 length:243 start_codon:yes stop_codon:yes gene_type:complete